MELIDYRDHLIGLGLADDTIREYVKFARRLVHWSPFPPHMLAVSDLRDWSNTLPPSWASRKQARSAVMHWMRWHDRHDNCWAAIIVPRKPDAECRAVTPEDARLLRDAAVMKGGREGAAVLIVLYTAARRLEVARMQWGHIDLPRSTIRWPRAKRGRSNTVDLHPVLADALSRLPRTGDYLFVGNNGRPHVSPATVWGWCRKVGDLAGVYFPTHVGRHTALATSLDGTKDLRATMDLAGHRDPGVTAIYTRTTRARMGEAVAALDY